ncbi:hypothetical protein DKP78_14645 [Enterococcus faecium]|nr:hypothetical protein DKP78_14645 [Enterococcus faecium]
MLIQEKAALVSQPTVLVGEGETGLDDERFGVFAPGSWMSPVLLAKTRRGGDAAKCKEKKSMKKIK